MEDLNQIKKQRQIQRRVYAKALSDNPSHSEVDVYKNLLREHVNSKLDKALLMPYAEGTYQKNVREMENLELYRRILTNAEFRKNLVDAIVDYAYEFGHVYYKVDFKPVDRLEFYMNNMTKRLDENQIVQLSHKFDKELSMGQSR